MVKIAYLILCHQDPAVVARLTRKLTCGSSAASVFIHIDRKSSIYEEVSNLVQPLERVRLLDKRVEVYWGGYSAVEATCSLLRESFNADDFDRFVLLQGADYPIKTNARIEEFFNARRNVEFIRGWNCSVSKRKFLYSRARYAQFFDRPNLLKQAANKITRLLDLKLKDGHIEIDGKRWDIYWGCAQFAITRRAVQYILGYVGAPQIKTFFQSAFPADELFFHTLIFNSHLSAFTTAGGPESETDDTSMADLLNLTYFEYPSTVTVFDDSSFERLMGRDELFIRKVESGKSDALLELIDSSR